MFITITQILLAAYVLIWLAVALWVYHYGMTKAHNPPTEFWGKAELLFWSLVHSILWPYTVTKSVLG